MEKVPRHTRSALQSVESAHPAERIGAESGGARTEIDSQTRGQGGLQLARVGGSVPEPPGESVALQTASVILSAVETIRILAADDSVGGCVETCAWR